MLKHRAAGIAWQLRETARHVCRSVVGRLPGSGEAHPEAFWLSGNTVSGITSMGASQQHGNPSRSAKPVAIWLRPIGGWTGSDDGHKKPQRVYAGEAALERGRAVGMVRPLPLCFLGSWLPSPWRSSVRKVTAETAAAW